MSNREIQLDDSWLQHLKSEFEQPYMQQLSAFLRQEKASGQVIYPRGKDIFAALNHTPFNKVKVVILGQDPYHGPNQAHGLSFSVPKGERIPPSLINIYKEIETDLGLPQPTHGNLLDWADQGVLLLNSVLTVRRAQAASHRDKGWERFTDQLIAQLNQHREHLVFMLWGSYAQKKGQTIDRSKHAIFTAPHPSPLSAHRGFLGCKHFSQCNVYLEQHSIEPIDWSIQP
ncbi:MAG: uracil-DNA glycosylase [Pseudomonadota bacterium]